MQILNATDQFEFWGFKNPLPIPPEIDLTAGGSYTLKIQQSDVQLGLYDEDGLPLTTTVWGYGTGTNAGYLGPTLLAYEGNTVSITWQNQLPLTGHLLPVDYTLHRANPIMKTIQDGFTPIVTHLHGAESDAASDGYPEAWYTQTFGAPGPAETGPFYTGNKYTYDNEQEAAPLWYHDHALGLTRLNVYAGLAGFYRLTDDNEQELVAEDVLPEVAVPLVIQDKAFTTDGQLYFPAYETDVLPDGVGGAEEVTVAEEAGDFFAKDAEGNYLYPENEGAASALPEFFGDHILVNGAPWPNLDVNQGAVTYELVNGSDSRFYVLDIVQSVDDDTGVSDDDDLVASIVGTDGGLLPYAVAFDGPVVFAPGDRLEIVLDFSGAEIDDTFRLLNSGPDYSPFKGFNPDGTLLDAVAATPDDPVGNVMQFTVTDDGVGDTITTVEPGTPLNPDIVLPTVTEDTPVRRVGLFEGADEYGRVQPLLGTAEEGKFHPSTTEIVVDDPTTPEVEKGFGPLDWFAPTTEMPVAGTTEKWEIYNFTADAHPVHLHLTQFEGIGRREIQFKDDDGDGIPDDTTGDGEISYGDYSKKGDIKFKDHDIWVSDELIFLEPEEGGRQDTLYVPSGPEGGGKQGANIGSMLEIAVDFEKPGLFVWHCHILSHEDHEMMRPMEVLDSDLLIA
jgi:spore coat protein A